MLELIQGESGVHVLDKSFVRQTIEFCRANDILVIIDEVQTGNGRTGYMYSYQAYGIMPDIVTTAKGLGGGLPIGACLLFEKAAAVFSCGDHGTTFGGNPAICAGALNVVKRLTVITILVAIPTLIAGLLGMNIDLTFGMGVHGDGAAWEFWVILILSVALTAVSSFLLAKMTDSVKIRTPKQVKRKRRRD